MKFIHKYAKPLCIIVSSIIIIILSYFQVLLDPYDISLTIFFTVPVIITIWCIGQRTGLSLAIVSSIIIMVIHINHAPLKFPFSHFWHSALEVLNLLVIAYVFSVLKNLRLRDQKLSRTDALTGVTNRRYFYEVAENEKNRSLRFKKPLSLVYIDIDNFKNINDSQGHYKGDQLLSLIADVLKKNIRSIDTVARLGGDEFALLLAAAGYDETDNVIHRICESLRTKTIENDWNVTFSVGAVTFLKVFTSIEEMIKKADELMYSVKEGGKNNVRHVMVTRF